MDLNVLAERIRVESEILAHSREALLLALRVSIDGKTSPQWVERCRFLTEVFERHVTRLFRIKWEIDDEPLMLQSEQPGLIDDLIQIESEQRELAFELRGLTHEARQLSPENLANLHAFRQRLLGFVERFDDTRLRECKIWLDACDIEIGGEG